MPSVRLCPRTPRQLLFHRRINDTVFREPRDDPLRRLPRETGVGIPFPVGCELLPTKRCAMLHGCQRKLRLPSTPVNPRKSATQATIQRTLRRLESYVVGDLFNLAQIRHFKQHFFSIDGTATVEAAISNDNSIGRRNRLMKFTLIGPRTWWRLRRAASNQGNRQKANEADFDGPRPTSRKRRGRGREIGI